LPARGGDSVRIAAFNIQTFGTTKIGKPEVVSILARICREFDVVAIQEVRSRDQDIVPRLVESINAPGRYYDYVIGPRLPQDDSSSYREQFAFVFDRERIEVDRHQLYTVHDPHDLLVREPLVAWFRVRGLAPEEAFTFMLTNVHTDPDRAEYEVEQLAQVYHAVLEAGHEEDDIILLGDFNVDDRHLGSLGRIAGMEWAITGDMTTNTRRTAMYDNIVFHRPSTNEFTGRSGVLDFMREYGLSLEQALEVSDHLPVWAEFTAVEGGRRAAVAARPQPASH
jgi:deoxyribonuclease-1-like protein